MIRYILLIIILSGCSSPEQVDKQELRKRFVVELYRGYVSHEMYKKYVLIEDVND